MSTERTEQNVERDRILRKTGDRITTYESVQVGSNFSQAQSGGNVIIRVDPTPCRICAYDGRYSGTDTCAWCGA